MNYRKPSYISPSSMKLFYSDIDAYYYNYISPVILTQNNQNNAMALGSGFDAYVKSHLHKYLAERNKVEYNKSFELETIFNEQVKEELRKEIHINSLKLFEVYKISGALKELEEQLILSLSPPIFQNKIINPVTYKRTTIPLCGCPDIFYINNEGCHVLLDWKTTGYYSNRKNYPTKGYLKCRTVVTNNNNNYYYDGNWKNHKSTIQVKYKGEWVNGTCNLEDINKDWADQLCIYCWLCGNQIGDDFISRIEQIVCNTDSIDVVSHYNRISPNYQKELFDKLQIMWDCIESDNIYKKDGLTLNEAQSRMKLLEEQRCYVNLDFLK